MSKLVLKTSLTALLLPTIALANTPNVVLDQEVITVSKMPTNIDQSPARISILNQDQIQQDPTLNLSDLLKQDPSISIKQSGGIGQISEVSLRGTKSVHTLFLSDGARLNNQNNLSPVFSGFYDLNHLQRVEILKGAASVQYGSDAIGGVVQMISKTPTKTGASMTGVWGENNTYKVLAGADFVADNGLYATISGQRLESDGTRIFDDQHKHLKASYDQKGHHVKVGANKENFDISASVSQNQGVNMYSATTDGRLPNVAERHFDNRLMNIAGSYNLPHNVTLSARYAKIDDKQTPIDGWGNHYNTQSHDGDINARWYVTPNQNLLFGISHLNSEYDSNTISNAVQKTNSTGYYLQHQYNNEKLNTQAGIRLEDHDRFGQHTVGQLAGRYHITPATSVYGNIGTAFRAPSLNEMYTTWGGNDQLEPEESISYEIGLDQQLSKHAKISLSAYHTTIDGLIENPNWAGYQNIHQATFKGGEIGMTWKKDAFFITGGYAHVATKNKNTGLELSYRPKHTGTLRFGYDDGTYGASLAVLSRSNAKHYSESGVLLSDISGSAIVDVDAYWQIKPSIKLFTNIHNIGNKTQKLVYNTYPTVNWYVNDGHQANIGVTFSY